MSSIMGTVIVSLRTALAAANGAGAFNHDLTATDRRIIGTPALETLVAPAVYILPPRETSEHGTTLGSYIRRWRIPIVGCCQSTDGTDGESAIVRAIHLYSDVTRCLEADRTFGGLVRDIILSNAEIDDGAVLGAIGYGFFSCEAEVYFKVSSAGGS
jgi:hypothetical protein